ncbi:MAG: dTDP-4-dehydrorhamnose 3,5-epimerase [Treponemataceae bacterium]
MSKFKIVTTPIKDLYIIEPTVYEDSRGYFMEVYNQQDFADIGLPTHFVQDNQSKSTQGVLRGLHFQKTKPQGKLVRVLSGEVFDVAVDIRKDSETFGKWHGVVLSSENKKQFYVPEGFAHGFIVLSETAEFAYKCTNFYNPADEAGILWNDKKLNIDWQYKGEILLSEKDKKNQPLDFFL